MEMRRKDRMLNEDQTLDILNRSEYGILSTIGVDNVPYGVPMNFVYEDGVIYFHCAKAVGYKVSNIIHNSNACFTVINVFNQKHSLLNIVQLLFLEKFQ